MVGGGYLRCGKGGVMTHGSSPTLAPTPPDSRLPRRQLRYYVDQTYYIYLTNNARRARLHVPCSECELESETKKSTFFYNTARKIKYRR